MAHRVCPRVQPRKGRERLKVRLLLLSTRVNEDSPLSRGRLRHLDRGPRPLIGLTGLLLLVACSRDLGQGKAGTGGGSGTGGGPGGGAGTALAGTGGLGAAGGAIGGTGGGSLPECAAGAPAFTVCAVSSADVLPLAYGSGGGGGSSDMSRDSVVAADATVEAIGTGVAPAPCQTARLFGAAASSDWWLQVRTADTNLWTIGVHGLGNAPAIQIGDRVTLDVQLQRSTAASPYFNPEQKRSVGFVQLADATGTPLVWAGSDSNPGTWLSLSPGRPGCANSGGCTVTKYEVTATVNGSVAILQPYGAAHIGGYSLAIGENSSYRPAFQTECAFYSPPQFAAAALREP